MTLIAMQLMNLHDNFVGSVYEVIYLENQTVTFMATSIEELSKNICVSKLCLCVSAMFVIVIDTDLYVIDAQVSAQV